MIFVDSSALVALVDESDAFHLKAIAFWEANRGAPLVTSNWIAAETLGWIRYRLGKKEAVEMGHSLRGSKDIEIVSIERIDDEKAWKFFLELPGRGVSFIDCTSFALMERVKIKRAFTFDLDFKKAGFEIVS